MASPRTDKYRSFLHDESEKDTKWRVGEPPNYDLVNKLFEEGRTKIWPPGSLEEKVQNLLKTWEMEVFHKVSPVDWKTMVPDKISFSLNGSIGIPARFDLITVIPATTYGHVG